MGNNGWCLLLLKMTLDLNYLRTFFFFKRNSVNWLMRALRLPALSDDEAQSPVASSV